MKSILLAILLLTMGLGSIEAQVPPKALNQKLLQKSLKAVLGTSGPPEWQAIAVSESDKKELKPHVKLPRRMEDTLHVGRVVSDSDTFYVMPDVAPSKSEVFSYVLYLDTRLEIYDVDVLKYRENYGYEIDYPLFRRQFKGRKDPKQIIFGRTIQNISGATISARSLTYAVHDLLVLARHYQSEIK